MHPATSVPFTTSHPSIPPSDGRCQFFELPAKLRNEVYEYALTTKDGMMCKLEDNKHFTYHALQDGESKNAEVNQLRYVCRQLRADT